MVKWLFATLFAYAFTFGATWNGIVHKQIFLMTLNLLSLLVMVWAAYRTVKRWRWHRTPLDRTLLIWAAAFAISTLTNWNQVETIAVGLWFAALYVALWYVLSDVLANKLISSTEMIESLLVGSIPVLLAGLHELLSVSERISGTLENPNYLAGLLIVLLPLACWRAAESGGWRRGFWLAYAGVSVLLLAGTGSRGAWLGLLAAGASIVLLHIPRRRALIVGLAAPAIAFALMGFVMRGDGGPWSVVDRLWDRLALWQQGISTLSAHPLTGSGLFTFRQVDYFDANRIHIHAHNGPLTIGAELGMVGLLALGITGAEVARALRRYYNVWLIAALVGVGVNQMVDFTLMMPALAVMVIVVTLAGVRLTVK